jgi:hypothetical protein
MASGSSVSKPRLMCARMGEVVLHLRQIQSAVVVAVAALKQQNCELDEDVANLLQRSVADRIQEQIERLEITVRMAGGLRPKRQPDS